MTELKMLSERHRKHQKSSYFRNGGGAGVLVGVLKDLGLFNKHDLPQTGTLRLLLLYLHLFHIYQCMLHCWPGETTCDNFSLQTLATKTKNNPQV